MAIKHDRLLAKNIPVESESIGFRLDKFLIKAKESIDKTVGDFSRARMQNLIKQGLIKVNGQSRSPHYKLKKNDLVNIKFFALAPVKTRVEKNSKLADLPLKIVSETSEYLIIDKPAGVITHGKSDQALVLTDILIKKYPRLKNLGDDPSRPGIIHRLDKDVSGLMVIAKTRASFLDLKKQFQRRMVNKEYTALAYGKIDQPSAMINFPIRRAKQGYKMAALPLTDFGRLNQVGKPAETYFKVIKNYINYTLLKIKINTGRTHQIRVHLFAYNHPLVGDNIYGTAKTRLLNKKLNLNRVFLVADKLGFSDLSGQQQTFSIGLPDDLKKILQLIK